MSAGPWLAVGASAAAVGVAFAVRERERERTAERATRARQSWRRLVRGASRSRWAGYVEGARAVAGVRPSPAVGLPHPKLVRLWEGVEARSRELGRAAAMRIADAARYTGRPPVQVEADGTRAPALAEVLLKRGGFGGVDQGGTDEIDREVLRLAGPMPADPLSEARRAWASRREGVVNRTDWALDLAHWPPHGLRWPSHLGELRVGETLGGAVLWFNRSTTGWIPSPLTVQRYWFLRTLCEEVGRNVAFRVRGDGATIRRAREWMRDDVAGEVAEVLKERLQGAGAGVPAFPGVSDVDLKNALKHAIRASMREHFDPGPVPSGWARFSAGLRDPRALAIFAAAVASAYVSGGASLALLAGASALGRQALAAMESEGLTQAAAGLEWAGQLTSGGWSGAMATADGAQVFDFEDPDLPGIVIDRAGGVELRWP